MNRLIYSKGYERMTTQDILDDAQISRGAFYHYFAAKEDAVFALIERMGKELNQHLRPVVIDTELSAIDKLKSFFHTLAGWKTNHKDVVMEMTRAWYSNDNTLIREKFRRERVERLAPLIGSIMAQGCRENVFVTDSPEQMGELIVCLILDLNESIADTLLQIAQGHASPDKLSNTLIVYNQTLLRALGISSESLQIINVEEIKKMIQEWFIDPGRIG